MGSDLPLNVSPSKKPRAALDKTSSDNRQFDSKEREQAIRALVRMSRVRYKLASIKDPAIDLAMLDKYLFDGITYVSKVFRSGTVTMPFEQSTYQNEIHGILEGLADVWEYLTGPEETLDKFDVDGLRELETLTQFFLAHLKYTFPKKWVNL